MCGDWLTPLIGWTVCAVAVIALYLSHLSYRQRTIKPRWTPRDVCRAEGSGGRRISHGAPQAGGVLLF